MRRVHQLKQGSQRWLRRASAQGLLCRLGTGCRGDGFRYWLPGREPLLWPGDQASDHLPPRKGGRLPDDQDGAVGEVDYLVRRAAQDEAGQVAAAP